MTKEHILIVDNDLFFLQTVASYLNQNNYTVFAYTSPLVAIQKLKNLQPMTNSILITDVQMDEMDGFALTIQAKKIIKKISVIMMTASNSQFYKNKAIELGVVEYLEKPFPLANIKDILEPLRV